MITTQTLRRQAAAPSEVRHRSAFVRAGWVGGLLGAAAAFSGVASPISAIPVRPWHVLLLAAAIVAFSGLEKGSIARARLLPLDLTIILYTTVTLIVELLNSAELGYRPDPVNVASALFYFVAYVSARAVSTDLQSVRAFLRAFIWPIFIITPIAVGQSLGIPLITRFVLTFAPGEGALNRLESGGLTRATGFVGHWTGFGGYLIVIVAMIVAILAIDKQLQRRRSRAALLALVFAGLCLVTTLTFSVIISALLVVIACWRHAGLGAALAVILVTVSGIAAAVFGTLISSRLDQQFAERVWRLPWVPDWVPDTIHYRLRIWADQTIPMIFERPVTGWGTGLYESVGRGFEPGRTYPNDLIWHSPESQWFGTAMTFGIAGLVAQLVMLAAVAVLLIRANRSHGAHLVARPALILFVAALITAVTVPIFTNRGFPVAWWPLVGVVAGLSLHLARRPDDDAIEPGRLNGEGR